MVMYTLLYNTITQDTKLRIHDSQNRVRLPIHGGVQP
jgi:hypothetical protein